MLPTSMPCGRSRPWSYVEGVRWWAALPSVVIATSEKASPSSSSGELGPREGINFA
jgi:hypothetical protein